ncbi:MAG: lipopolysaccharide assembly protein LapB [Coxiellaceae bacterium]|nr:lipopolysaccharide assembly protein LapB [Coxiellaceae bacterium]
MILPYALSLLPVAATCGYWVGSRDRRKKESPKWYSDYFKGLNYLLNEQPDKAVDVFIKLLEVDSDTVETHLALGSLFRRRGEVDRSTRIHQNLIARPQLDKIYKVRALAALAQDYLKAGVLDRAERLFLELAELGEIDEKNLKFLLHIYQQEKDWRKAIDVATRLEKITGHSMLPVVAQYHCELADIKKSEGNFELALEYCRTADAIDHDCVRASLLRAEIEMSLGNYEMAIRSYKQVKKQDPSFLSETIEPLVNCYQEINKEDQLLGYLNESLKQYQRFSLVKVISQYRQKQEGDVAAIEFLSEQIRRRPSLRALRHLLELYIENSAGRTREKLVILQNFMDTLLEDKPLYRCRHCGFSGKILYWLCPSCHHWMSVKPILGLEGN